LYVQKEQKDVDSPVFIAVLFTIAKCSREDNWMNKMWYTEIIEYYLTLKRRKTLIHGIAEDVLLSEISQAQKDRYS
jgi:hypothetical protein